MDLAPLSPTSSTVERSTDICTEILLKYGTSAREDDKHLCSVVFGIAQSLKDQSVPLKPAALFCATCSSLDRLSSEPEPRGHTIAALLKILSKVVKTVPAAIIVEDGRYLNALLVRALKSSSLTVNAAVSGSKCLSNLLQIGSWRVDKFTIGEFASRSDKEVVSALFKKHMHSLLQVARKHMQETHSVDSNSMQREETSSTESNCIQLARLLDLAVSFLPGLGVNEVNLLLTVIEVHLQDRESLIQKKAYKALSIILRDCDGIISSKIEHLLKLMEKTLPSCRFPARRRRLDCLYLLVVHVLKSETETEQRRRDLTSSFLIEIMTGPKMSQKKRRNKDILVQIGHACGDEDKGGNRENLYQFIHMVAGGLASKTPAVKSAAMKGLARLANEFSDLVSTARNFLPLTFLLHQRENREMIKHNLDLLKVLVAKSQAEDLQLPLKSMVEALLKWQDDTKTQFKAKVKILLEMLVKKCGLDAVKAVMPPEHMKLLTNIQKIKEQKERKHGSKSHASKATKSRWNHSKVFSDIDEDTDDSDSDTIALTHFQTTRSNSTANKNLPDHLFDQLEDEPLDLLDRQRTRSSLQSSKKLLKRKRVG